MSQRLICVLLAASGLAACTDAGLYHRYRPPAQPDRVTLAGRVCTEDPASSRFPVKIVVVVDQASGPLFSSYDPSSLRIATLTAFVQSALTHPEYEIAIIGYAGRSRKLAPITGNFTRNPGELLNAVNQLSLPEPCIGVSACRDYREGLRSARALIEGDMSELTAGERILTQYIVILVNAGFHQPLSPASDCCQPTDTQCIVGGTSPSQACQSDIEVLDVIDMGDAVANGGGAGLRLHVLHLAAEPVGPDNDRVAVGLEKMAFAGKGLYQRFNSPNTFTLTGLDVLNLRTVLKVKHLIVTNVNAIPTALGPVPDSDGDGLADDREITLGTDPTRKDTDGDGISDLVELLVGFDPLVVDTPAACQSLVYPGRDLDRDGLSNCDEALIGTDLSLVDSDGDGLPDKLELVGGTDYLNPDAVIDSDGDGIVNGDEITAHTDPRSSDATNSLASGYRYSIDDEGIVIEPTAGKLRFLTGVEIAGISDGSTPGLGTIRFFAGAAPTLNWQDASDSRPGPAVAIVADTPIDLPSSSFAPVQGEAGRKIVVRVTPSELPPVDVVEQVRILFRERQCLSYTVRNIRLMHTLATQGRTERGWNDVFILFAQAPEGRNEVPGPFRIAHLPFQYLPPDFRNPPDAVLTVFDEEFIRPPVNTGRP